MVSKYLLSNHILLSVMWTQKYREMEAQEDNFPEQQPEYHRRGAFGIWEVEGKRVTGPMFSLGVSVFCHFGFCLFVCFWVFPLQWGVKVYRGNM